MKNCLLFLISGWMSRLHGISPFFSIFSGSTSATTFRQLLVKPMSIQKMRGRSVMNSCLRRLKSPFFLWIRPVSTINSSSRRNGAQTDRFCSSSLILRASPASRSCRSSGVSCFSSGGGGGQMIGWKYNVKRGTRARCLQSREARRAAVFPVAASSNPAERQRRGGS
jgi:hypothetical protein